MLRRLGRSLFVFPGSNNVFSVISNWSKMGTTMSGSACLVLKSCSISGSGGTTGGGSGVTVPGPMTTGGTSTFMFNKAMPKARCKLSHDGNLAEFAAGVSIRCLCAHGFSPGYKVIVLGLGVNIC
ncbi:hypothetical protein LP420_17745 [Massilia sp. B-10]|nr:hypothetical protein LP420_17745 [Massilia sp. B-10]